MQRQIVEGLAPKKLWPSKKIASFSGFGSGTILLQRRIWCRPDPKKASSDRQRKFRNSNVTFYSKEGHQNFYYWSLSIAIPRVWWVLTEGSMVICGCHIASPNSFHLASPLQSLMLPSWSLRGVRGGGGEGKDVNMSNSTNVPRQ